MFDAPDVNIKLVPASEIIQNFFIFCFFCFSVFVFVFWGVGVFPLLIHDLIPSVLWGQLLLPK